MHRRRDQLLLGMNADALFAAVFFSFNFVSVNVKSLDYSVWLRMMRSGTIVGASKNITYFIPKYTSELSSSISHDTCWRAIILNPTTDQCFCTFLWWDTFGYQILDCTQAQTEETPTAAGGWSCRTWQRIWLLRPRGQLGIFLERKGIQFNKTLV